ncbi:MAG: hypothetical protein V3U19_03760 [Thermodesulfobacteriota bacterium]
MIRQTYRTKEGTLGDIDTLEVPLNGSRPMTELILRLEMTGGAGGALTKRLAIEVTNIQIVDGSHVIFEMPLYIAMALQYHMKRGQPILEENEQIGGVERCSVVIPFGLFRGDPKHYFNPADYDNPVLRITTNLTINGTDGWATGTGRYTVLPIYLEGGITGKEGILRSRIPKQWTTSASGDEDVTLSRENPLYMLMLMGKITTKEFREVITNIKLTLDQDTFIPFDLSPKEIMLENEMRLGGFQYIAHLLEADDASYLTACFRDVSAHVTRAADEQLPTMEANTAESLQFGLLEYSTPGTQTLQTSAQIFTIAIKGQDPYGTVSIPFDLHGDGKGLDLSRYREAILRLTQGTASALGKVVQTVIAPR